MILYIGIVFIFICIIALTLWLITAESREKHRIYDEYVAKPSIKNFEALRKAFNNHDPLADEFFDLNDIHNKRDLRIIMDDITQKYREE